MRSGHSCVLHARKQPNDRECVELSAQMQAELRSASAQARFFFFVLLRVEGQSVDVEVSRGTESKIK